MTYPYFTKGLPDAPRSRRAEEIPTLNRDRMEDPDGYIPHSDLTHAVNVSLVLGMPLLVTGEPGTGKTQLANVVAHELEARLHKFETKSTSLARELFYTYDAITSFKTRDVTDQRMFIQYQALGRAILDAFPKDHPRVARLVPPEGQSTYRHEGPRRSVVLIDEIDKAPRDFPNDLLNEIERLYFRVPELHNAGTPGAEPNEPGVPANIRPIVIITSNSEKGLPDPFLRRCVYFDIPFPKKQEMKEIVARRISGLAPDDRLLADAIQLFFDFRHDERVTNLRKQPSTAELLNWLQMLLHRGAVPGRDLHSQKELVVQTIAALVKNPEDRRDACEYIEVRWKKGEQGN
jgi:MoxR-like ATPase